MSPFLGSPSPDPRAVRVSLPENADGDSLRQPTAYPSLAIREEKPAKVVCARCKLAKLPSEFRKNARKSNGLSSWCAACHTRATAAWRQANPGAVEGYNAARRAEYARRRR